MHTYDSALHWLPNTAIWHHGYTEWHCVSLVTWYSYLAPWLEWHGVLLVTKYSYLAPWLHRMTLCLTGYIIQLSGTMVTHNDIVPHWLPNTAICIVPHWLPNTAIWRHGYIEWHCASLVTQYRYLAPWLHRMTLYLTSYLIQLSGAQLTETGTVSYTTGWKIWHHSDRKWHCVFGWQKYDATWNDNHMKWLCIL